MTDIIRRRNRPSWMTPFHESWGDVFQDRLWPDWMRDTGVESMNPSMDILEKDGKYVIKAQLPGVPKENINVSINDSTVTISGKSEENREEEEASYYLKESYSGSFSRSFRLPAEVDGDDAQAQFEDGVLKVELPVKENGSAKKIEIKP